VQLNRSVIGHVQLWVFCRLFLEGGVTADDAKPDNESMPVEQPKDDDDEPASAAAAAAASSNESLDDDSQPHDEPDDVTEKEKEVVLPENGEAVKFVADGDVGSNDVAKGSNGPPTEVPTTSADVVITPTKTNKTNKEDKDNEPHNVVPFLQMVKLLSLSFVCLCSLFSFENARTRDA